MTSLQGPGSQNNPDPFADVVARLEALRRELNDLTSSVLKSGGIRVSPEGMTIESALDVEGSLGVSGSLDVTGDASFSGDTTIGGNAAITGTLSLPAGIIDNEALANPVVFEGSWGDAFNFPITTTSTTVLVSSPIVIPPGFTKMSFMVAGMAQMGNTAGATQFFFAQPYRMTNGTTAGVGTRYLATLSPGQWQTVSCPYVFADAVTPGDVITFALDVYCSTTGVVATTSNTARLEVSVSLTR